MTALEAGRFERRAVPDPPPISLRIVVDGASTAGKTTTARSLGDRLGRPVVTPEEVAGRTLLFDWMDHTGGRSDGRAIRTQVVAVPGHLPHLRARLLVTADVVLFVADTSAPGMADTTAALAQVRELLAALPEPRPGLLVQANKRDHPEALPLPEVRHHLGLGEDDLLIETVATEGEGVRQSYVYAVRLGLQHARAVAGPRIAERQQHAEDLLAELDTDPRPAAERLAATDVTEVPVHDPDVSEAEAASSAPAPDGGDHETVVLRDDRSVVDGPHPEPEGSDPELPAEPVTWPAIDRRRPVASADGRGGEVDDVAPAAEAGADDAWDTPVRWPSLTITDDGRGDEAQAAVDDPAEEVGTPDQALPTPPDPWARYGAPTPGRRPAVAPPWRRWLDRG